MPGYRPVWLALAIGCLLLHAQIVQAHATLLAAVPAPGARLARSPAAIELTFDEPVKPTSTVFLIRQDFKPVSGVRTTVDSAQPGRLVATVPELEPGHYSVQWTAVAGDGHEIRGSYEFQVITSPQLNAAVWTVPFLLGGFLLLLVVRRRRRR